MAEAKGSSILSSAKTYIIAGLFTILPIWVTWLIVAFLLGLLGQVGGPAVAGIAEGLRPHAPWLAGVIMLSWVRMLAAAAVVVVALCGIGWFTTRVIGRRVVTWFDVLVERIPLIKMIYGSVKKLLVVLQQQPEGMQRVVLIDFPSPEMKTVGLVTRTFTDEDTGRELAAVYVPTTPNPTSGYLEIVPVDRITPTTWSVDEAMTFIVSAGAVAPPTMHYERKAQSRQDEEGPSPPHPKAKPKAQAGKRPNKPRSKAKAKAKAKQKPKERAG